MRRLKNFKQQIVNEYRCRHPTSTNCEINTKPQSDRINERLVTWTASLLPLHPTSTVHPSSNPRRLPDRKSLHSARNLACWLRKTKISKGYFHCKKRKYAHSITILLLCPRKSDCLKSFALSISCFRGLSLGRRANHPNTTVWKRHCIRPRANYPSKGRLSMGVGSNLLWVSIDFLTEWQTARMLPRPPSLPMHRSTISKFESTLANQHHWRVLNRKLGRLRRSWKLKSQRLWRKLESPTKVYSNGWWAYNHCWGNWRKPCISFSDRGKVARRIVTKARRVVAWRNIGHGRWRRRRNRTIALQTWYKSMSANQRNSIWEGQLNSQLPVQTKNNWITSRYRPARIPACVMKISRTTLAN